MVLKKRYFTRRNANGEDEQCVADYENSTITLIRTIETRESKIRKANIPAEIKNLLLELFK